MIKNGKEAEQAQWERYVPVVYLYEGTAGPKNERPGFTRGALKQPMKRQAAEWRVSAVPIVRTKN